MTQVVLSARTPAPAEKKVVARPMQLQAQSANGSGVTQGTNLIALAAIIVLSLAALGLMLALILK